MSRWRERSRWCLYRLRNAKGCLETTRNQERVWNRFSLPALRGNQPYPHPDLGLLAFGTVRHIFVKPPSLWDFVTAALSKLIQLLTPHTLSDFLPEALVAWPHSHWAPACSAVRIHKISSNLFQSSHNYTCQYMMHSSIKLHSNYIWHISLTFCLLPCLGWCCNLEEVAETKTVC